MMHPVSDASELDELCGHGVSVLFKHSPRCWISRRALDQVEAFAERNDDVPVYLIDVLEAREFSDRVAERLEVEHESPQAIVVRDGRPVDVSSHFRVTTGWLKKRAAKG